MSERSAHRSPNEPSPPGVPTQLRLLAGGSVRRDWVLDDRTRTLGRQGVAQAREILRQARPPEPKHVAPVRKAS